MTENRPTKPIAADPPSTSSRAAWWRDRPEWIDFVGSFDDKDTRFALDEAAALLERLRMDPDHVGRFEDTP